MAKIVKQTEKLSEVEKLRIRMDYRFSQVDDQLGDMKNNLCKNNQKIDKVLTQLGSIAGQFKKFDEERDLLSDKAKEHTDQIEELQSVVFVG